MTQTHTFEELIEKLSQQPNDIELETNRYFSTRTERAQYLETLKSLITTQTLNLSRPKSPINLNLFASLLCDLYFEISQFDQSKDPQEIYTSLGSVQCLTFFAQNNVLILEESSSHKRVNLEIEDLIEYVYYETTHACLVGRHMSLAEASFRGHISFFELLNDLINWMLESPSDEQIAIRAGCLDEFPTSYILKAPLHLGYSALTTLPICIDKFPLEDIELTLPSTLESIPESLVKLRKLTIQQKNSDHQDGLTFPKYFSRLKNLTELNLDLQSHTKIPEDVFSLNTLETLSCIEGSLTELSPSIEKLTQLHSLILCDQNLKELPKEIGKLSSLKTLNLSNNQICELPSDFGNLKMLQELQLQGNPLTTLPKSMAQHKKLCNFIIDSYKIDWDPDLSDLKKIAKAAFS